MVSQRPGFAHFTRGDKWETPIPDGCHNICVETTGRQLGVEFSHECREKSSKLRTPMLGFLLVSTLDAVTPVWDC